MKTKNIILIAFLVLLAGLVSCKKDHDIPTGKVFNAESGGGDTLGGGSSTDSIIVSVSANPIDGGTVTGGGTYQQGHSCTVTATANEGYSFTNWTENDNVVSTQASYQFTVTGNRTLVANFNSNIGNYAYVDLGLPSGLLWATCNVGATLPEEYGDRYAWGEIQPKDTYSGYNYKFSDGTNYGYNAQLTKYCTKSECGYLGFVDDLTILLPEDDAATVNWGVDWRMPTNEEWLELYQNTTYIWTTQNNVDGMLFTASNGNRLFLPASPTAINRGLYWSSSLHTEYPHHAWEYRFYSNSSSCGMEKNYRYEGNPIRAVRSSMQNNSITVSANPSEGGTVTGSGTYQQGQSCTVTATANEGYSFINWTENDIQVSTDANYTFTVTGNRTLVANFIYNGGSDDHAYVDLGLASGLLWATCNVGADNPEDYGDYFAWGETQPKDYYDWSTYKYCNGNSHTLTKYCNNSSDGYNGFTDNLTILEPGDDAATAQWGSGWRMPTKEEWQALLNMTVTWTTQNGVNGRLIIGTNGNSLFLPAAGEFHESSLNATGSYGDYWSSSLSSSNSTNAWYLDFNSQDCVMYGGYIGIGRDGGRSVRAVRSAK